MTLPDHLFISDTDGALYDTRIKGWSFRPPLRADYRRNFAKITTPAQMKATLRYGSFAWPNGYQMYLVLSDGEALSFEAARAELRQVLPAIRQKLRDGWRVIGTEINYEDTDLMCAHTGKPIPAAYADASPETG